jgi:hypothetical protein
VELVQKLCEYGCGGGRFVGSGRKSEWNNDKFASLSGEEEDLLDQVGGVNLMN